MTTEESLKEIYDEATKKIGASKARKYLTTFFSNMIFDLEEGQQLNAEMIKKKIEEELVFIKKVEKEDAA